MAHANHGNNGLTSVSANPGESVSSVDDGNYGEGLGRGRRSDQGRGGQKAPDSRCGSTKAGNEPDSGDRRASDSSGTSARRDRSDYPRANGVSALTQQLQTTLGLKDTTSAGKGAGVDVADTPVSAHGFLLGRRGGSTADEGAKQEAFEPIQPAETIYPWDWAPDHLQFVENNVLALEMQLGGEPVDVTTQLVQQQLRSLRRRFGPHAEFTEINTFWVLDEFSEGITVDQWRRPWGRRHVEFIDWYFMERMVRGEELDSELAHDAMLAQFGRLEQFSVSQIDFFLDQFRRDHALQLQRASAWEGCGRFCVLL